MGIVKQWLGVRGEQALGKTLGLASKDEMIVVLKTLIPIGPPRFLRQKEEPSFARLLSQVLKFRP